MRQPIAPDEQKNQEDQETPYQRGTRLMHLCPDANHMPCHLRPLYYRETTAAPGTTSSARVFTTWGSWCPLCGTVWQPSGKGYADTSELRSAHFQPAPHLR